MAGLGLRSWHYWMLVEDSRIMKMFVEPNKRDDPAGVGVQVSDADTMLAFLQGAF